jgi:hypothetical protein
MDPDDIRTDQRDVTGSTGIQERGDDGLELLAFEASELRRRQRIVTGTVTADRKASAYTHLHHVQSYGKAPRESP